MRKKRVLFLCTGNSCRSQMAEGLTNYFMGETWEAVSAGTRPTGYIHPLAVKAAAELGVELAPPRYHSKLTDNFIDVQLDLVVTVCDNAADDCPVWLGSGNVVHIEFPDPADAEGTEEAQMVVFRQVRDDIRERILGHLQALDAAGAVV